MKFNNFRKRAKEIKEKSEQGRANFFALKPGETAIVRFNGPDDPHLTERHYLARTKKYMKHRDGDCVLCYYRERGRKEISFPQALAVFNLIDNRWFHVEQSETDTRDDGTPRTIYAPCLNDARCKGCRRKAERQRGGQKYWELAISHAENIEAVHRQLQEKCKSCSGQGDIRVNQYQCPECDSVLADYVPEDDADQERVRCGECKATVAPKEVLECSEGCESPERGSLLDTNVRITRTGGDKTTTYNMVPQLPFEEVEDWMLEFKPYDLNKVCCPQSADVQAKKLGMKNPFAARRVEEESESYDDDSEHTSAPSEEDEDQAPLSLDDEEDPFEEKPKKDSPIAAKPQTKVQQGPKLGMPKVKTTLPITVDTRNVRTPASPQKNGKAPAPVVKIGLKRPVQKDDIPF